MKINSKKRQETVIMSPVFSALKRFMNADIIDGFSSNVILPSTSVEPKVSSFFFAGSFAVVSGFVDSCPLSAVVVSPSVFSIYP